MDSCCCDAPLIVQYRYFLRQMTTAKSKYEPRLLLSSGQRMLLFLTVPDGAALGDSVSSAVEKQCTVCECPGASCLISIFDSIMSEADIPLAR